MNTAPDPSAGPETIRLPFNTAGLDNLAAGGVCMTCLGTGEVLEHWGARTCECVHRTGDELL